MGCAIGRGLLCAFASKLRQEAVAEVHAIRCISLPTGLGAVAVRDSLLDEARKWLRSRLPTWSGGGDEGPCCSTGASMCLLQSTLGLALRQERKVTLMLLQGDAFFCGFSSPLMEGQLVS